MQLYMHIIYQVVACSNGMNCLQDSLFDPINPIPHSFRIPITAIMPL